MVAAQVGRIANAISTPALPMMSECLDSPPLVALHVGDLKGHFSPLPVVSSICVLPAASSISKFAFSLRFVRIETRFLVSRLWKHGGVTLTQQVSMH